MWLFVDKYFRQDYDPRMNGDIWKIRIFELYCILSAFCFLGIAFLVDLHCFLHPTAIPYPAYRVPSHALFWLPYLVSCCWFAYFCVGAMMMCSICIIYGSYFFGTTYAATCNELRIGQKWYRTRDELRTPKHLVLNWRALEVELRAFNVTGGLMFVPLTLIFTSLVVFCFVSLIFHGNKLSYRMIILMSGIIVMCTCMWGLVLYMGALEFTGSGRTLKSWLLMYPNLTIAERKYMKRLNMSCKPLHVGDGKRYMVTPITVLRFINSLGKNTFRACIAYSSIADV